MRSNIARLPVIRFRGPPEVQALEDPNARLVERMAVEGAVLHLEADLRWSEVCEQLADAHQA